MRPEGVTIYLADHVDEGRLERRTRATDTTTGFPVGARQQALAGAVARAWR
jgi:hypothetical protein